jgi:hypothetical protein
MISDALAPGAVRDVQFARDVLDTYQGRAPTLSDLRSIASTQREFEQLSQDLELDMPLPDALNENPRRYREECVQAVASRVKGKWGDLTLNAVRALGEGGQALVVADAKARAADPSQGSFIRPGQLRQIERRDDSGRVVLREYRGNPKAWMNLFAQPHCLAIAIGADDVAKRGPP